MSVDKAQIQITSPCPISLDRSGVSQADRSMFCGHCVKDVHLLSKMSEREARVFMREHEGQDICVSYAIRADGGIRFRPEPAEASLVPIERLARRRAPQRPRLAQAASIGAAALLAACTAHSDPEPAPDKPTAPLVQRAEPVEPVEPTPPVDQPCDPADPTEPLVAGGLVAMPIDEIEHDVQVEGGIKAVPVPEPTKQPTLARGGMRAKRIADQPLPAD
ncbi:hypothetical protein DB30_05193 [Enhygromyxa salina]|uniref:Uncharacterized protein n=1 Tax=Enhygromyxa salina TaxID=215803 RepID=A0A0C2CY09_9BACT|nr:hypothetical protein [Enhygromyxa salina]KIG15886.1 hypothetical protein DB30_05193 [Enhygromyxa salina]